MPISIFDQRRSEIANSEDNAYARECYSSKNVKINRKTRCLLSFANSVSSHDNEFVVQSNFRRKDIRILDKFMKDVRYYNNII